jgi:hypothetical protein
MAELEHLREMDLRLLALHSQTAPNGFTPFWGSFFKDKIRAGEYYLDGKNYAALAKEIIELVFPEYVNIPSMLLLRYSNVGAPVDDFFL